MANPNWIDKWSLADLEALVEKREVERKQWNAIAIELGKPVTSCHRRYDAIVRLREPAPPIVAEQVPVPFHRQLGIETFEHLQAVTDYVGGYDRHTGQYFSPHQFRERVTLVRVP